MSTVVSNPSCDEVAARFSAQASSYERYAYVQKKAAVLLDMWLCGLSMPAPATIAEIGCGTGLFTRLLRRRYPRAHLTASDIAPDMVAYCRGLLGSSPSLQYAVCDGRIARFAPSPDWIVSAMCMQWMDPLMPVLRHHLQACGMLAFSVVLDGSFQPWRTAHRKAGQAPGLRALPDYRTLVRDCYEAGAARVHAHRFTLTQTHPNGMHFAAGLRAIGASCPQPGHRPGNLKPVLRQLSGEVEMNYEIGFFCLQR